MISGECSLLEVEYSRVQIIRYTTCKTTFSRHLHEKATACTHCAPRCDPSMSVFSTNTVRAVCSKRPFVTAQCAPRTYNTCALADLVFNTVSHFTYTVQFTTRDEVFDHFLNTDAMINVKPTRKQKAKTTN